MPYNGLWTFPSDTEVVWNTAQFFTEKRLKKIPPPRTFVRSVTVVPRTFSFCSLERLLVNTDRQLDRVAECIGGNVLPHTWGIIEGRTDSKNFNPIRHWFGRGYYGLFANVHLINHFAMSTEQRASIEAGLSDYYSGFSRHRRLVDFRGELDNMRYDQITYGTDATDCLSDPTLYVHDIEPRFEAELIIM